MLTAPTVIVHRAEKLLAQAVAARLITRLVDAQAARGHASVVLTGGGIGTATLAEVAAMAAHDAIDWSRLDVWWGDERFLPTGHEERNETAARSALLDHVDIPPERVHPMPASDGSAGDNPERAADSYTAQLYTAAQYENRDAVVPSFDVMLLGIGPEGHVASLFPEQPALYEERPVVAVHGAPKPPPLRLSLTLPAIQAAREVWVLAAGGSKAGAVRLALSEAGPTQVPATGARGRRGSLFLLDSAAASQVPAGLDRRATP